MSKSKTDKQENTDKDDSDILERITDYILSLTIIQLIIILLIILWVIYLE